MKADDPKAYVTNEAFDMKIKKALGAQTITIVEGIMEGITRILKDYATKKDIAEIKEEIQDIKHVETVSTNQEASRRSGRVV